MLKELQMKKSLGMAIFTLMVTLAVSPMISVAADTTAPKPRLAAKLVDGVGGVVGGARYDSKIKDGKTFSKLGVKLEHLKLKPDTKVIVRIGDMPAGTATVKADGKGGAAAELVLDSAKGDKVPPVKDGTPISAHIPDGPSIGAGVFHKPPM